MWLLVDYEPVAAFGLRPSNTTSSGGKSLVCPTPYAIKMALLDRAIRMHGIDYGMASFEAIKRLRIAVRVPLAVAVNRTFQKVLRPDGKLWTSTIAQREFCIMAGVLTLAFSVDDQLFAEEIALLLASNNYFGRRGSFMQFAGYDLLDEPPAPDFVELSAPTEAGVPSGGFLQRMDDMRPNAGFEQVSNFSAKPSSDGGRVSYTVILPYHLAANAFNHTIYETNGA